MGQEFSWSCWPESRVTAQDVARVQDTLSQAIPGIVRQDILVKSNNAPLTLLVQWVIQNTPPATYGYRVGQLVEAVCSAVRRMQSAPATATTRVAMGTTTIDMSDPRASVGSHLEAGAAFDLAYQCATRCVNTFGEPMDDLLSSGPSVGAGQSWPAPVLRVLLTWSEAAKEWRVSQVELVGRGGLYVPQSDAQTLSDRRSATTAKITIRAGGAYMVIQPERVTALNRLRDLLAEGGHAVELEVTPYSPGRVGLLAPGMPEEVAIFIEKNIAGILLKEATLYIYNKTREWARKRYQAKRSAHDRDQSPNWLKGEKFTIYGPDGSVLKSWTVDKDGEHEADGPD